MKNSVSGQTEGDNRGYDKPRMVVKKGKEPPTHAWANVEFLALPNKVINPMAKLVYIFLKFKAGTSQVCWPAVRTIAKAVGTNSNETIERACEALELQRFILILPKIGKKGTNVYIATNKADNKGFEMHWPELVNGFKRGRVSPDQVFELQETFYHHAAHQLHRNKRLAAFKEAQTYFMPREMSVPIIGTLQGNSKNGNENKNL